MKGGKKQDLPKNSSSQKGEKGWLADEEHKTSLEEEVTRAGR